MDQNQGVLGDMEFGAMKLLIEKAKKSATSKSNQFKREMKKSENELIAMQDPLQDSLLMDDIEEAQKMEKQLEDIESSSDDDSNFGMEEYEAEMAKYQLKNKYENALKDNKKLEADAKRSCNDPSPDTENNLADLKQRHKHEAEVFKKVHGKLMSSFKKDMDKLMGKFDAEYSRLRKAHSEAMADTKGEQDNADTSSTHQP
ncbi:myosin-2 heavy chain isoform X2 [Drosophila takahashii]|uniref:myosin-2 heavy chain isoform X2 n=1 Tax=Drosophila takahashii TaxID=29030 RepID=UPI0038996895